LSKLIDPKDVKKDGVRTSIHERSRQMNGGDENVVEDSVEE